MLRSTIKRFQLAKKTADTWLKSHTKACADVGGYLEGKKRQAQKDQDQRKKDGEKKEIAAAKAQAKEARTKMKSAEQLKGAICCVDDRFVNSIPDVTVAAVKQGSTADIQKPWVIRKCPEVDKWKNEPGMILRLSEYGGGYKNTGHGFREEGRTQQPMASREGKEETEDMFKKIIPQNVQVDLSGLSFGQAFMDSVWLFGYSHDMVGCWPTPNSASTLKVFVHGQVEVICFAAATLDEHLKCETLDDLAKQILRLDSGTMSEAAKGSPPFSASINAGDSLHAPAGWLVCEQSIGGALIYGVRGRGSLQAVRALSIMKR